MKLGIEAIGLFGILTMEPSGPVANIQPKAMPIILMEPEEIEIWMTAPRQGAKGPQHLLQQALCRS